jgi:hypothetical protein
MKSPISLGVILLTVFLVSCTSLENVNNTATELNNHEGLNTRTEATKDFNNSSPMKIGHLEERIEMEVPSQLSGSIEDEALRVTIHAEIELDNINYKTNIVFSNKNEKSMDLIYDCGLLISNDNFAQSTGDCLAVESMLLKKNQKETQTIILPKEFFDNDNNLITIRYRHDEIMKCLKIQLKATNNDSNYYAIGNDSLKQKATAWQFFVSQE